MQVIRTNSWQSQLGNILGSLIGNNYQSKEENRLIDDMKTRQQQIRQYINPTEGEANDWRNNQADLTDALNEYDVSDEMLSKLGGMVGGNIDKYKSIRDAGQSILKAQTDYGGATDDAGRQAAHQSAVDARKILAQYGYDKGFGEADNVTFDSLKDMHKTLLNDFSTDAYEQWRNNQLMNLTGVGLLGKGFKKF